MPYAIPVLENAPNSVFSAEQIRLNLCAEPIDPCHIHFTFRYTGETCSWGRQPVEALMHAVVEERSGHFYIQRGWIDLPPHHAGTHFMCEYQRRGPAALEHLALDEELVGQELGEMVQHTSACDAKPCFCRKDIVNHKWGLMGSVILQWQAMGQHADAA